MDEKHDRLIMSIDWLFEQIARRQGSILQTIPFYGDNQDLLQLAKAMHKREHIETYNQGYRDGEHDASNIPLSIGDISEYNNAENYYNDTFKKEMK